MAVAVGELAPDIEIEFIDGEKKNLTHNFISDRKPIVVTFYCNFCPACTSVVRKIEVMAAEEKYKDNVHFILINLKGIDMAKAFNEEKGLTDFCPHGAAEAVGETYNVQYIPHRCLIGKDGRVIRNYKDFTWADLDLALEAEAPPPDVVAEEPADAGE